MQWVNFLAYIKFDKADYSQSSAIFELFIKKSNAENIPKDYSTTLIWAAKSADKRVIRVEILKY